MNIQKHSTFLKKIVYLKKGKPHSFWNKVHTVHVVLVPSAEQLCSDCSSCQTCMGFKYITCRQKQADIVCPCFYISSHIGPFMSRFPSQFESDCTGAEYVSWKQHLEAISATETNNLLCLQITDVRWLPCSSVRCKLCSAAGMRKTPGAVEQLSGSSSRSKKEL